MRTRIVLLALLALVVAAASVQAAGQPMVRRRTTWGQPMAGQPSYRYKPSPFDTARRLFDLTDEQKGAVGKLQQQRYEEYSAKLAELNQELDKKFILLVVEVIGPDNKGAYQQVLAAIAERDEAIATADAEARKALVDVRTAQGFEEPVTRYYGNYFPRRASDVIRYAIKLADDQGKEFEEIRRDSWREMGRLRGQIPRPKDRNDRDGWRKYSEAYSKARKGIEEKTTTTMMEFLNDDQKKAFGTADAAIKARDKKVKDAEGACDKKLTELLGEEKFRALRGYRGAPRPPAPAQGGQAPKKTDAPAKKPADF